MRDRLAKFSRVAEDELFAQDWQAAERHALRLLSWRQDLGWAYDIAGWAAERRGDIQLAVSRYLGGLRPSVFSDNTIRFRTHWFADGFGKFSAVRLNELRKEIPTPHRGDAYLSIYLANDNATLRNRIRDYWLNLADAAAVQGNHAGLCVLLQCGMGHGPTGDGRFPRHFPWPDHTRRIRGLVGTRRDRPTASAGASLLILLDTCRQSPRSEIAISFRCPHGSTAWRSCRRAPGQESAWRGIRPSPPRGTALDPLASRGPSSR